MTLSINNLAELGRQQRLEALELRIAGVRTNALALAPTALNIAPPVQAEAAQRLALFAELVEELCVLLDEHDTLMGKKL